MSQTHLNTSGRVQVSSPLLSSQETNPVLSVALATTAAPGVVQPDGTTITISNGVISGASSGPSAPAIRGSGMIVNSSNTYTIPLPAGTVAGDFALLFLAHAYTLGNAGNPTGFTLAIDGSGGSSWFGYLFTRVLNATDITTGSVTVTTQGIYSGVVAIITFVGPTSGIRASSSLIAHNSGTATSRTNTTPDGSPRVTDMGVYFASSRQTVNVTVTINQGTQLQQANDGAGGTGCLSAGAVPAAGGVTAVASFAPTSGTADIEALVFVAP